MVAPRLMAVLREFVLGFVLLTGGSMAIASEAASTTGPAKLPIADCLLVDTDGNLDDLRALAVLAPFSTIRAVIVTDGMVPVVEGTGVLKSFLGQLPGPKAIPVLAGAGRAITSPSPPSWSWLAGARADVSRVYKALSILGASPLPAPSPSQQTIAQSVSTHLEGCKAVGLLMIGPWSSFLLYQAPVLGRLAFVVAQGRSPFDATPEGNLEWDRVNCKFDRDACTFAQGVLQQVPMYWVDLPDKGVRYPVTKDMIGGLKTAPLALALKRVLFDDPALVDQQQWDDMAAIFILRPDAFRKEGQHFLPRLEPGPMRELERALISGER